MTRIRAASSKMPGPTPQKLNACGKVARESEQGAANARELRRKTRLSARFGKGFGLEK